MRISQVSSAAIAAALLFGSSAAWAQDNEEVQDSSQPDSTPSVSEQVSRTDIVVTAGSREQLRNILSPGAVSVVYPDDTKGEHKSLPDLLDQIPGVYVRRVGGTGGYTTTSIRGSAPSQVNIYIDGIPYNTSSEVAADISTIPIGNVERVEVYRGTVPARFSGAPLGGAINIVTKKAKGSSGTVSGGARSFGGWQASGNMNLPVLGGSLLIGADGEASKGDFQYTNYDFEYKLGLVGGIGPDGKPITYWDPYNFGWPEMGLPARTPRVQSYFPVQRTRQNNSFERYNGLARWTDDHFSVKYGFTYLRRFMPSRAGSEYADLPTFTYPLPATIPGGIWDDYLPTVRNPRKRQVQTQQDIALGWHDNFGGLDVSVALNMMDQNKDFRNQDLIGLSSLGALWSNFNTRRYGGQIDLAYTLGEGGPVSQRFELHGQVSREIMDADANGADSANAPGSQAAYYQHFKRDLVNFQAQDTITIRPLGDLQITPIFRVERLFGPVLGPKQNVFGPSSGDYDWLPTWGVSAKKNFGNLLIFANTGTYNRYPNFYEIYGDGLNVQAGSSFLGDLTPLLRESGRNSDVGVGWNGGLFDDLRGSVRVTGFARKTENTITYYATPVGSKYINSGTTLTRGVEFEGNLILGSFADLQTAFTWQNGRYTKGTFYWFGGNSALARVGDHPLYTVNNPRAVGNARLNLHFMGGALTAFGEVRHTGKRYTYQGTDSNGDIDFAYEMPLTTLDMGAHYKFPGGFTLSAGVIDITNAGPRQRYRMPEGFNSFSFQYYTSPTAYHNDLVPGVDPNVAYPQQGRTYYVTLAKSFGAEHVSRRRLGDAGTRERSWTGLYVGGAIGRGWAARNADEPLVFDTTYNGGVLDGVFNDYVIGVGTYDPTFTWGNSNAFQYGYDGNGTALGVERSAGIRGEHSKALSYGFHIGYDRQIGDWLVGGVAEWSRFDLSDAVSGYGKVYTDDGAGNYGELPAAYVFDRKLKTTLAARVRGGRVFGRGLVYATGGVVRGEIEHGFTTQNTYNSFTLRGTGKHRWGTQVGGGAELRVAGPFTIGLEYLHTFLSDDDFTVRARGGSTADLTGLGLQLCPGTQAACAGTDIRRGTDRYIFNTVRVTAGVRF